MPPTPTPIPDPFATADPVAMLTSVGIALVLVALITIAVMAREEIAGVVKALVGRYIHIERRPVPATPHVLSSPALDAFFDQLGSADAPNRFGADTDAQNTGSAREPVAEPVRSAEPPRELPDDAIIVWLAQLRVPGKSAYRFSSNKIYDLMGGTREITMKRVAELRNDPTKKADAPAAKSGVDPIVDVARDPLAPNRDLPVRQAPDGQRYILGADGQRQPV